jgi:NADH:ubiquinone oxidoreductase subunit C
MLDETISVADQQAGLALEEARRLLARWLPVNGAALRQIKVTGNGRADSLTLVITPDDLLDAVQILFDARWGYLATITGTDLGAESGQMEVLYHFCEGAAVLTLCVMVDRATAVVPTVCRIIPSASFYERELSEMFGITVHQTPNTDRLFLPDEWPVGVYPLRKDFIVPGLGEGNGEQ